VLAVVEQAVVFVNRTNIDSILLEHRFDHRMDDRESVPRRLGRRFAQR
jgi:hypothetical protein